MLNHIHIWNFAHYMKGFFHTPLSLWDKIAGSNFGQPKVAQRVRHREVANQRDGVRVSNNA